MDWWTGLVDLRTGGFADWWAGGLVGWWAGGLVDWRIGRFMDVEGRGPCRWIGWMDGHMQWLKSDGRPEDFSGYEYMDGGLEGQWVTNEK